MKLGSAIFLLQGSSPLPPPLSSTPLLPPKASGTNRCSELPAFLGEALPAEETRFSRLALPPRDCLCFLLNQEAGSLVCLLFNYLFSPPLEDRVRSDPLLLKHQIEGRTILSVKVYNNLSIHRMQNNKM